MSDYPITNDLANAVHVVTGTLPTRSQVSVMMLLTATPPSRVLGAVRAGEKPDLSRRETVALYRFLARFPESYAVSAGQRHTHSGSLEAINQLTSLARQMSESGVLDGEPA